MPPTNPQLHAMPAPPPPAPAAQFDAMASMRAAPASPRQQPEPMNSQAAPARDSMSSQAIDVEEYNLGDEVEVWSNSHKRWSPGTVEKVEAGKVSVKYASPDGAAMIKQMPECHEHLRHRVAPGTSAPAMASSAGGATSAGEYKVGDKIEIWSNSQNSWCRGSVEKLQGELVNVKYMSSDGQAMTKLMPSGHEYLRHLSQQVVPPPPPPPGRNSHHLDQMPPPLAESAGREDSREIDVYAQACNNDYSSHSAMASQMHGGTPMASINIQQGSRSKAYQSATSKNGHGAQRLGGSNEVFVAESTSWVPSGSMALCGMPIKANKKEVVALNDDGTPVARCPDTDRCCRCSMPIGSYFDHTCPRCSGVVCLHCLDDLKFVIASYRCPCCGDQKYNEEALKTTLSYLKWYRNAQRAVGAVPVLFAGLFGVGPEGVSNRKQACAMEEEEQYQEEIYSAPVAAPKPKMSARGPPPPPPKPKANARSGSKEVPEYHTRPPAGWEEGAAGWAGQRAAAAPDPATVAAALQKASAAQAAAARAPAAQPASQGHGAVRPAANPLSSANGAFSTRIPPSPMR